MENERGKLCVCERGDGKEDRNTDGAGVEHEAKQRELQYRAVGEGV